MAERISLTNRFMIPAPKKEQTLGNQIAQQLVEKAETVESTPAIETIQTNQAPRHQKMTTRSTGPLWDVSIPMDEDEPDMCLEVFEGLPEPRKNPRLGVGKQAESISRPFGQGKAPKPPKEEKPPKEKKERKKKEKEEKPKTPKRRGRKPGPLTMSSFNKLMNNPKYTVELRDEIYEDDQFITLYNISDSYGLRAYSDYSNGFITYNWSE